MDSKQAAGGVFTAEKGDRVRSLDELDAYIRVVRPGTMILVGALALVLAALIVWSLTGTIPYTTTVNGYITTYYRMNYFFYSKADDVDGWDRMLKQYDGLNEKEKMIWNKKRVVFFPGCL